jgi:hypothetical protein
LYGCTAAAAICCAATSVTAQTTDNNNQVRVPPSTVTVPDGMQYTNRDGWRPFKFEGHRLSTTRTIGSMLYTPSDVDNPTFRAEISAAAGGATVDYFDTRAATPDLALLQSYDCVMTYCNYAYADMVLFGDRLAQYVDSGGVVILGSWCTYTTGNYLSGAIMEPAYCPVDSPTGTNHMTPALYAGDGVTCIYDNVTVLEGTYRDFLVLQGAGIQDGSYTDGEICHAYRPDGHVVYANGMDGTGTGATGDVGRVLANAGDCLLEPSIVDCVCNGQFDAGDRVMAIVDNPAGQPDVFAGDRGTVTCGGAGLPPLLVFWDGLHSGHDGYGFCECPPEIRLPPGCAWYVFCDDVQAVSVCPFDLNNNGNVDFGDILQIIGNWGPCP